MIAGGGLGQFAPEDIGPADEQAAAGVVDIVVEDEAEAVATAKRCLAYFQGDVEDFETDGATDIGSLMPGNRRMTYDVRRIIVALADVDSMTELGATLAPNLVTAFIRIEGKALGVLANNPRSLAGAIDSAAARKAADFMALCDTHGIPLLSLCDTPGIMAGPEAEKTGTVRHASQMFVAGAKARVP
jgi:acetyl-CoA carboxylase carboxyltransferase component